MGRRREGRAPAVGFWVVSGGGFYSGRVTAQSSSGRNCGGAGCGGVARGGLELEEWRQDGDGMVGTVSGGARVCLLRSRREEGYDEAKTGLATITAAEA